MTRRMFFTLVLLALGGPGILAAPARVYVPYPQPAAVVPARHSFLEGVAMAGPVHPRARDAQPSSSDRGPVARA